MRLSNHKGELRAIRYLRLCLGIIIALTLAAGGLVLNTGCLPGVFTILPLVWVAPDPVTQCVPFTYNPPFSTTGEICPGNAATFVFYWPGPGIPAWVNVDPLTGVLSGCADNTTVPGPYTFQVGATGFNIACWPASITADSTSTVTLNLIANAAPPLTITPTFYPVAWEMMPFSMILNATGCSGTYTWSAAGLPLGLSVTDNSTNGIISGIPEPGTCGAYTVTVTCTDTGYCPTSGCCPPVSRPFILYVDCWASVPPVIYPGASCDFSVQIGPGLTQGQTNVIIDGSHQATLGGGQSTIYTSYPCQSHIVLVDDVVIGPDGITKYKVTSQNPQNLTDAAGTAYFDYAQEVLINTASNPAGISQPPNSGYYAVGTNFISTAVSPVIPSSEQNIKYIFRDWMLPDSSLRPERDLTYVVNTGGTVTADYDTYYLLTLQSDFPSVHETQWSLKDSTATYSLALQPIPIPGFWGYIGGVISPVNASGSHLMTGPYTQVIEWTYNFTVPIIIISIILALVIALVFFLVLRKKRTGGTPTASTTVTKVTQPGSPVGPATPKTEQTAITPERPNFCPNCGAPAEKDAAFCKKCGKKIG